MYDTEFILICFNDTLMSWNWNLHMLYMNVCSRSIEYLSLSYNLFTTHVILLSRSSLFIVFIAGTIKDFSFCLLSTGVISY